MLKCECRNPHHHNHGAAPCPMEPSELLFKVDHSVGDVATDVGCLVCVSCAQELLMSGDWTEDEPEPEDYEEDDADEDEGTDDGGEG